MLSSKEPGPWLRQVRNLLGISQNDLALKMNVKQAAISRLESRDGDVTVNSLTDAVEALGGKVEIRAQFPGGELSLLKK